MSRPPSEKPRRKKKPANVESYLKGLSASTTTVQPEDVIHIKRPKTIIVEEEGEPLEERERERLSERERLPERDFSLDARHWLSSLRKLDVITKESAYTSMHAAELRKSMLAREPPMQFVGMDERLPKFLRREWWFKDEKKFFGRLLKNLTWYNFPLHLVFRAPLGIVRWIALASFEAGFRAREIVAGKTGLERKMTGRQIKRAEEYGLREIIGTEAPTEKFDAKELAERRKQRIKQEILADVTRERLLFSDFARGAFKVGSELIELKKAEEFDSLKKGINDYKDLFNAIYERFNASEDFNERRELIKELKELNESRIKHLPRAEA